MTTKMSAKPTSITLKRSGHWRNHWWSAGGWFGLTGGQVLISENELVGPVKYDCPQKAEQAALKLLKKNEASGIWVTVEYLGPKYYKED